MKRGCAQAQPLFRPVGSSFLFVPGGRAVGLGFFGGTAACGKAAAEGPVEVVAAAAAGAVQRLAHKVESRTALELEIVLDLVQKQAAAGGLSLLPAAGCQALEPPALGCGGEFRPRGGGQGAGVFRQTGIGPEGAAQLCGQQAQPELRRPAAQQPDPLGEQRGQLGLTQSREEVEGCDRPLRPAPRGQQTRKLHDADARKSVLGELHLARFPGKHPAICAVQQAGAALGPDAGQRLAGMSTLQGCQAGIEGGHPSAALGGEPGAEAIGAELGAGIAAHGADDGVGPQGLAACLGLELDRIAAPALAQALDGADGRVLAREMGEVQFTEYGLSGICIMQLSGLLAPGRGPKRPVVALDLFPALSETELTALFAQRVGLLGSEAAEFWLGLLPAKLGRALWADAGLPENARALPASAWPKLAATAKCWRFEGLTPCGWKQAQTTGGGLLLDEVEDDFQFKGCPGLYFVGETLDCAGSCGGYNLHWAFGSGIIAGRAAAKLRKKKK